jgi:hypothetical protein
VGLGQPFVENAVKTTGFFRVALDAVTAGGVVLPCKEMAQLVEHEAKAAACHISHSSTGTCAARLPLGQIYRFSHRDRSGLRRIQTR